MLWADACAWPHYSSKNTAQQRSGENRSADRRTNQIAQVRLLNLEQWCETDRTKADASLNHNGWCRGRRNTSHRIAQVTSIRAGGIAWQAWLLLLVSAWRGYHPAVWRSFAAQTLTRVCRTRFLLRLILRRAATRRITSQGERRRHIPWRAGGQIRQQADQGYQAAALIGHESRLFTKIVPIGQFAPFSATKRLLYFSSANRSMAFNWISAFRVSGIFSTFVCEQ